MKNIINMSRAQIGIKSKPYNDNKFNTWYYGGPVNNKELAWCVVFLRWVFAECGKLKNFCGGEKTASCTYVMHWAQLHGCWHKTGYKVGDMAIFTWSGNGPEHIGVITEVVGNGVYKTIEGNTKNSEVAEMVRSQRDIIGVYRPDYEEEVLDMPAVWSASAREWAVDMGLFIGDERGSMHWTDSVTREELALILFRVLGEKT